MAILRSFNIGISGLKSMGQNMSIIGDNIANSQTTGFKASRGEFQDVLSLSLKGIDVFSLQKGPRTSDIKKFGCESLITDLNPTIRDFSDTAQLISELDLLISVDTAVAHLGGAMGRPVWLLLPYSPDWRWMRDTKKSLWYPSITLFRQKKPNDWDSVLAEVQKELSLFLKLKD